MLTNFHCGTESVENKILFVRNHSIGDNSRGGSLIGNKFCFALLDWGYQASVKRWAVANLGRYGLDPNGRWNENRIFPRLTQHDQETVNDIRNVDTITI